MSADSSSRKGGEALRINDEELRIIMVGKTGAGKSATGNTILGFKAFESKFSATSLTTSCEKVRGVVGGRKVVVVDTPGLFDTRFTEEETLREIKQSICFAAPGPHVFLVVIKLGRFTDEEQKTVEMIQEVFGKMSTKYNMILLTCGDQLEDETVEEFWKNTPKLQELIRKCEDRYHVFNNKTKDLSQVTELLEKINNMVLKNGGSHYTNEMFQEAEKHIEEEKQIILKENEEKRHEEVEKLIKTLEGENLEKQLKMLDQRYEQEAREKAETSNKFLTFRLITALGRLGGAYIGASAGFFFGPVAARVGAALGGVAGGAVGVAVGVAIEVAHAFGAEFEDLTDADISDVIDVEVEGVASLEEVFSGIDNCFIQ